MDREVLRVVRIDRARVGPDQDRPLFGQPHRGERREKRRSPFVERARAPRRWSGAGGASGPISPRPGQQRQRARARRRVATTGTRPDAVPQDVRRRIDVGSQMRAHREAGGLVGRSLEEARGVAEAEGNVARPAGVRSPIGREMSRIQARVAAAALHRILRTVFFSA